MAARNVRIIYSSDHVSEANVAAKLVESQFDAKESTRSESEIALSASAGVAQDTAVVFISDQATASAEWQSLTRSISTNERVIPIGGLSDGFNYDDATLIPTRIEEINYIPLNDDWQKQLSSSLTTPLDFFNMRSDALLNMGAWEASGNDAGFLVPSLRNAMKWRQAMRKRLRMEEDPALSGQLQALDDYLTLSIRHGVNTGIGTAITYLRRFTWVILAVALLVGIVVIRPYFQRASIASSIFSSDTEGTLIEAVAAIRFEEGRANNALSEEMKAQFSANLVNIMGENWQNCPIGALYKWARNDLALSESKDYVWVATGEGCAVRWNVHNGAIEHKEQVSPNPLVAITCAEDESSLAALDSEGFVYVRKQDGTWINSEQPMSDGNTYGTTLVAATSWNSMVAYTDDTVYWIDFSSDCPQIQGSLSFDHVHCALISTNGKGYAIAESDNELFWLSFGNGKLEEKTKIPVIASDSCSAVMSENRAFVADECGNVLIWDSEHPDTLAQTGLKLSFPLELAIVDEATIVYHDRNAGTRLFSLALETDLGGCVSYPAAASRLKTCDGMIALWGGEDEWFTEDVTALLPTKNTVDQFAGTICEGTSGSSETGPLRSVEVVGNVLVGLEFAQEITEQYVVIDGTQRLEGGESQKASDLDAVLPDGYGVFYYAHTPFTGTVTLATLLNEGSSLVFGTSDGHLFDLKADSDATVELRTRFQAPTHAAIVRMYVTDDCYMVEDATGSVWKVRAGSKTDLNDQVRDRLHATCYAFNNQVFDIINPQIWELYEIEKIPGSDGKEWE